MENICRHWAYNPFTGELLGCTRGRDLKRRVKEATRYYARMTPNRWHFAHGTQEQAWAKFQNKAVRYHE